MRPATPETPNADQCGDLHLLDRGQLPGHQANRTDPAPRRCPAPIGVVVGVVGADLQTERHHQRQDGVERSNVMAVTLARWGPGLGEPDRAVRP